MKNLLISFCLIFIYSVSLAKVAYLPVAKNEGMQITERSLIVLDLDNEKVIKQINFGVEIGAVFLSNNSDKLYVAAHYDNTVFLVDTTTLTIVNQWDDLPVGPTQIVLNKDNDKLFFISHLSSSGDITQLYSLDLTTNQTSSVYSFSGENTERLWYSKNLNYLSVYTYIPDGASSTLFTFNLDTEALISNFNFNWNYSPLIIDNNGNTFYYLDYNSDVFTSKSLGDGSTNWTFQNGTDVRFFLPVISTNTITVTGYENTYSIDKTTGIGSIISPVNALSFHGESYQQIQPNKVLTVNFPLTICALVLPFCSFQRPINVVVFDYSTNTITNIYRSENYGGSSVSGRFIGEKLFVLQLVPVASSALILFSLIFMLMLLAYKTRFSQK